MKFLNHWKLYGIGAVGLTFGLLEFILSLVFNTSFHIMGVDIAEFISSMVSQFFLLILISYGKILFANLVFYFVLGSILYYISLDWNLSKRIQYGILFLITFLAWIHSVGMYPQLYGEFFYIRFPSLQFLLHFITDWLPPFLITSLLVCLIGYVILRYSFLFLTQREKNQSFVLFLIIVFGILHYYASLLGLFIFALMIPWLHINWKKVPDPKVILFILGILFLGFFPYLSNLTFSLFLARSTQDKIRKPNIFILSADSLRADKLGFLNGNKDITPNIDLFAKDGIVFKDHHVTIPRTFPSWADLLTGEYSMAHGIRDMFPAPSEKKNIGTQRFPTLPQILRKQDYYSAVVGSFAADIFPRANWSFDDVYCPDFNAKILTVQRGLDSQMFFLPILTGSFLFGGNYISEVDGLSTLGDGLRVLPKWKSAILRNIYQPLFMLAFSSVVHFPYTPPYPFYKKFTNPDYYGKYKYLKFVDPTSDEKPNSEDIQEIRSLFDSSVHAYDSEFGEMIKFLKAQNLYEDSIIILTADHGEALYEDIHGQGHGEHLRGENVTKVPLIIKFPKVYNESLVIKKTNDKNTAVISFYEGVTSSIDIFPTLLDYLSIKLPSAKPGISLLNLLQNETIDKNRTAYSETGIWFSDRGNHFFQKQRIPYPNILQLHKVIPEEDYQIMITDYQYRETIAFSKHRMLLNKNFKLIYIPTREGVVYELYDRENDPDNQKNIWPYGRTGPVMKKELQDLILKESKSKLVGEYILPTNLP
jgi:arylsulfatase A-like enzyme